MNSTRLIMAAASAALALSLAGCWDDDEDNTVPPVALPAAVPDSAGASASAFLTYLPTLSATDESSEPLTIGDAFAVPADDTSEPTPLT